MSVGVREVALALALSACSGSVAGGDATTTSGTSTSSEPAPMASTTIDAATSSPTSGSSSDADPSTSTGAGTGTSTSTSTSESGSSSSDTGSVQCVDLRESIGAAGLEAHLAALAEIASDSDGNRAVGTEGYDRSVDYVESELTAMGYAVELHEFDIFYFAYAGAMTLEWVGQQEYVEFADYLVPQFSDGGDVTAPAYAVDVQLGLDNESTSGCEAADFAAFPAGNIAILQRGECEVWQKILAAQAAGAIGAIVFNQGDAADRMDVWWTSLGALNDIQIPVLLTSYAIGAELVAEPPGSVTLQVDANVVHELRPTASVLAETSGGDTDDVIVLGAHLDSVPDGPGINDNGSGVAALLEVARAVHGCETTRKVRFAWWTAEEVGLVGSTHYVESLDAEALGAISAYLNFDMVGSPNWARFRYDGDGSAFDPGGPNGSAALEQAFADWFDVIGVANEEIGFGGRSDYVAFVDHDIAAGGLFTGADGTKSDAQAAAHGGVAGEPFDGCYHQACDDLDNVDLEILESTARGIAYALEVHALP